MIVDPSAPFDFFSRFFQDAKEKNDPDLDLMTLSTVDEDGLPDSRLMLLVEFDPRGFVFMLNGNSPKAVQLNKNPGAALCFYWQTIKCCIRVRGVVVRIDDKDSDRFFATIPRKARIRSWVARQSEPIIDEEALQRDIDACEARFSGQDVSRPEHWYGLRLEPSHIQLWRSDSSKFHYRESYTRLQNSQWENQRIYP
uniref:Pyridoxamine 5'-phosphate oxidase n=1 Tax=Candidatus Kentrum sp. MB TaxID=2138164 RepID=A0A451BA01_9GAMM|nr:MAG: Pyridoxamine 5'-phosphate oxidase [Candidatus Kentron sp. MB]VFK27196.1 MAG: Pyridoxamine 5'-phosphate oxidase [Candidatus Kentron sp. MB]VFK75087.1 MAG: Pyridoxamine 5'-phosphate oxidase [Candidatus Kentron sp. MB]